MCVRARAVAGGRGGGAALMRGVCVLQKGYTGLIVAAAGGHVEACKLLLDKGADVNAANKVCVLLC